MVALTTPELARACRCFMEAGYPDGVATIPASKRAYFDMAPERAIGDYLTPAPLAVGVCQELTADKSLVVGYEFRLGSATYPHLKLRVQRMEVHHGEVWVYSVNTHDGFHQATKYLSAEETDAWRAMVEHNRSLKHRIEENLALAGYLTPKNLLQIDLPEPKPGS